ncbi:MAG: putative DNA-binding domain-containing protein [Gammaproteobacteria bacterium]|nr:putative DNA-binding domain-containing protein [Gammaproteobacteria bacterium]
MAEQRSFQDKQYAFAAHIRDPEHMPAPDGVEDRRMAIYRELFFNNLRNLLGTMFPVLKKLHDGRQWGRLIRQFMRNHQAKTPYFLELPQEFVNFLQTEYEPQPDDHPFLVELAHYEYIELALSISTDSNDLTDVDPDGDLLTNIPVKSVLTWVYAYQYPVHRISTEFLPTEPEDQPIYLAVYRKTDDKVGFLELNPVTANLLNAIDENDAGRSGEELLREIAAEIDYQDVDAFIEHGAAALEEMRQLQILTGSRTAQNTEIQQ